MKFGDKSPKQESLHQNQGTMLAVEGDCHSSSGNGFVETKATMHSTDNETDNPPLTGNEKEMPVCSFVSSPARISAPQGAPIAEAEPSSPSKWGKLQHMSKIVCPLLCLKKIHSSSTPQPKSSPTSFPTEEIKNAPDALSKRFSSFLKSLFTAPSARSAPVAPLLQQFQK